MDLRDTARYLTALTAIIVTVLVLPARTSARVWVAGTATHTASTVADGFRLTIATPTGSYPPDALVPVTVTLQNLSTPQVQMEMCAGFQPGVSVVVSSGHQIAQPKIPTGYVHPLCFDPTPGRPFPVGSTLRWTGVLLLTQPRLQAWTDVYIGPGNGPLVGGPSTPTTIRTPILSVHAAPPAPTRATLHISPFLHLTVRDPQRRPVYYSDRTECRIPYRGIQVRGTSGWQRAGTTIRPETIQKCATTSRWQVVVAVQGEAPAWFDRRPAQR